MYAFCVICSGVMIRFLYPDYQERPLKIFDWSSGTIFPFNVRVVVAEVRADTNRSCIVSTAHINKYLSGDADTRTLNEQFTFPFCRYSSSYPKNYHLLSHHRFR